MVLAPVLLVEDDLMAAAAVSHALDQLQLCNPLHTFVDVPDALKWLGDAMLHCQPPPSLVLLDTVLPRGCGLDLLGWLREQPLYEHTPVVLMTSPEDDAVVTEAERLGITSHLLKPLGIEDLVGALRRLRLPWALVNTAD